MKLQNMKRGETTEQITLFNWAENNAQLKSVICSAVSPHVSHSKRGKEDKRGSIKGHGFKERRAGRMLASAKPQFQRPLPGNEIRAE